MTITIKQLNMLGLAQRAGLLVSGDELVEKAIKKGQVSLVCCASDASSATRERYQFLCQQAQVDLLTHFTKEQISGAIGKPRTIVALKDKGMAQKMRSYSE